MALPTNLREWQQAIKGLPIDTDSLSRNVFPSGSKFSRNEHHALRIFYSPTKKFRALRQDHKDCFPLGLIKSSVDKIQTNEQLQKAFQLLGVKQIKKWTPKDLFEASSLGLGLALLQLIVDRKNISDDSTEEGVAFHKVFISPRVTRSMTAGTGLAIRPKPPALPQTPTPAPKNLRFRVSDPQLITDSSPVSAPATTPLITPSASFTPSVDSPYLDDFKRTMFQVGDEQTVNACLINLLLPVTWACGFQRSIHLDRKPLHLGPKDDSIYQACVDGIIMVGDKVKSFMEVKRSLRKDDINVRMQESAQMAAFIYTQGSKMNSQKG